MTANQICKIAGYYFRENLCLFVSCQNARVNSTKNRVMKNQKTLSCSFNLIG